MFDVLTAGRDRIDLQAIDEILRQHDGVAVRQRHLTPSKLDPLSDAESLPDLLVLSLGTEAREELEALEKRSPQERPSVLIIGPVGDYELMRLAMRAGARDFFFNPPDSVELLGAIDRAIKEKQSRSTGSQRQVTVVVGAKGGAGASFVATNIAHIIASHFKSKTALLDMDLQFGFLSANFNVQANDGLQQALESIDSLDSVALEGWSAKHESGVHLFGSTHRQLLLTRDFTEEQIGKFFHLVTRTYAHVVVDMPRQIDHVFASTLQSADMVVVVLQQSVDQLRDARTLMQILERELMIRDDQVIVAVNRLSKNALVSTKDIEKALRTTHVFTIINDYQNVTQSLNMGTPVFELNPNAAVTRDLIKLSGTVAGITPAKKGFLRRLLGSSRD